MTRVLAALLGAKQPTFQLRLNQLERAGGLPGVDIRLTVDILQRTRQKIRQLGLDPKDTSPEELYQALADRLRRDDTAVCAALKLEGADNQAIVATMAKFTDDMTPDKVFVIKNSVIKRLLKDHYPANAMKQLGYRSSASMLKHEPASLVLAAAQISESDNWWTGFRRQYANLSPSDFESRTISVVRPKSDAWQKFAVAHVARQKHNCLSVKELGVVLLLPIDNSAQVQGLALVLLMVVLQAVNDIRSSSSYLKFHQVKANFGDTVVDVASSRVYAAAQLANQPVAWQALHQYYAKNLDRYPVNLFEPHLQPEDLKWDQPEKVLTELDGTLEFWQDSQSCALTGDDGSVVSLNLFDAVLNYCNNLPFSARLSQYIRSSVWHDLTSGYLNQQPVESAINKQLSQA